MQPLSREEEEIIELIRRWRLDGAWGELTFIFKGGEIKQIRDNRTLDWGGGGKQPPKR